MDREYELVITEYKGRIVDILFENGSPLSVSVEEDGPGVNDIFMGKVLKKDLSSGGWFVEISPGISGYLDSKNVSPGTKLKPEMTIPVRISNMPIKMKKAALSMEYLIEGRYLILCGGRETVGISSKITGKKARQELKELMEQVPLDGSGYIVRTQAEEAPCEDILKEAEELKERFDGSCSKARTATVYSRIYRGLRERDEYILKYSDKGLRIVTDIESVHNELSESCGVLPEPLYDDPLPLRALKNTDTLMDRLLSKRVWLRSGGFLMIEPTEALTAIDVNSGKAGAGSRYKTKDAVNEEAAKEIMAQIRLRDIPGIILVDFIDTADEDAGKMLISIMSAEAAKDTRRLTIHGFSGTGLLEMTRQKRGRPLHEIFRDHSDE